MEDLSKALADSVFVEENINKIIALIGAPDAYRTALRRWFYETLEDIAFIPEDALVTTRTGTIRVIDLPDNLPDAPVLCVLPYHDCLNNVSLLPMLCGQINLIYRGLVEYKYRQVQE
jgi:hypothetical protein